MKVIRNAILPVGKSFGAINLFGVLFAKRDMRLSPEVINHELIHSAQMRELLYIPFYVVYLIEWILRLIQCKGRFYEAYRHISFEKEAYHQGDNPDYLKHRLPFAQWRSPNGDRQSRSDCTAY